MGQKTQAWSSGRARGQGSSELAFAITDVPRGFKRCRRAGLGAEECRGVTGGFHAVVKGTGGVWSREVVRGEVGQQSGLGTV